MKKGLDERVFVDAVSSLQGLAKWLKSETTSSFIRVLIKKHAVIIKKKNLSMSSVLVLFRRKSF